MSSTLDENNFGRPRKPLKKGSLGERIRKARLGAGYKSAKQLADRINVSQSTISQLETETINPRGKKALSTMIALARELGTDFNESWLALHIADVGDSNPLVALQRLPASLFTEETLRQIPDEQIQDYMHVIRDAYLEIEARLGKEIERRGLHK